MKGLALISVYDKTGLDTFAKALIADGYGILSTGGTADFLEKAGCEISRISQYTGQEEILGGRVKSLHPKIHAGILARRDNEQDMAELSKAEILPIDFVVVNLYPFREQIAQRISDGSNDSLIEFIDIGGPTMIRAAAKNSAFVLPVCDPGDYNLIIDEITSGADVSISRRRELAAKVFTMTAAYDAAIARYFSLDETIVDEQGQPLALAPVETLVLSRSKELRYGENPHQKAALYREVGKSEDSSIWTQLQGKELSYNNLLDMHGALDLFLELYEGIGREHAAVVIKHSNPCGAAIGKTPLEAFLKARAGDPLSAFGGIVACSGELDEELVESMLEGFVEVLIVESLTEGAAARLKKKKNLRVLLCDFKACLENRLQGGISIRNAFGDFLVQTRDAEICPPKPEGVVSGSITSDEQLQDMIFAWKVCKHVKSNAIVVIKDKQAIGIGAGQMSRVDSAKLAVSRALHHEHDLSGSVAASDAFLPFADTLEILNDAGVGALVQPGGSLKDKDVIAAAEDRSMLMIMTGQRHFRH